MVHLFLIGNEKSKYVFWKRIKSLNNENLFIFWEKIIFRGEIGFFRFLSFFERKKLKPKNPVLGVKNERRQAGLRFSVQLVELLLLL